MEKKYMPIPPNDINEAINIYFNRDEIYNWPDAFFNIKGIHSSLNGTQKEDDGTIIKEYIITFENENYNLVDMRQIIKTFQNAFENYCIKEYIKNFNYNTEYIFNEDNTINRIIFSMKEYY